MLKMKFKADATEFNRSVDYVKKRLRYQFSKVLKKTGEDIAENVRKRMTAQYAALTSPESKAVYDNIKSSKVVHSGGDVFVGIGNIEELDKATELIAKGSGQVYHLWRLMEYGFGMKGGFRSGLYEIRPVPPTRALVFYANGQLVFASKVMHPGAEGRWFFMTMARSWYNEDLLKLTDRLLETIPPFLESAGYKIKR